MLRTGHPAEARNALLQLQTASGQPDPEACWMLRRCDLQEGKTSDPRIVESSLAYRDDHPLAPEPAPYVGAARCAKCHRSEFDSQQKSRHGRTFLRGKQTVTIPFPRQPVPDPSDPKVIHSFATTDDHVEIQSKIEDRVVRMVVDYAFGSGDRGLTPVGHDERNRYFENRLSYYSSTRGWDVTSGQIEKPDQSALYQGSFLTPDIVWRCILCHHTNPTSIVNQTGPENADPAIGCERCHGPGGNHLLAVEHSSTPKDLAIARPAVTMGEPIIKLCGQCHDPRKVDFELTPDLPASVRFQATTLSWSLCTIASIDKLDCVTCHNPHRDAETSPAHYNSICLQCHSANAAGVKSPDHPTRREENRSGCRFFMSGQSGD